MGIPLLFILQAQSNRVNERRERLAKLIESFNTVGVEELDPAQFHDASITCRQWVSEQISDPDSAIYLDEKIREHPGGSILVAGRVESTNVVGTRRQNWYIIEFDPTGSAAAGEVVDFNPITVENPVSFREYGSKVLTYAHDEASPNDDSFWKIFYSVVGFVTLAVVIGLLIYWVSHL